MKREKLLSLFLVIAFIAPALFPIGLPSYECYVFYDATASSDTSVENGLEMLQTVCGDELPLRFIPVDSKSDFHRAANAKGSALFLFHGSDEGLVLGNQETVLQWSDLARFIDGTAFSEYFVLSCGSTALDEITTKDRVLTFVGDIDAKIAMAMAISKIDDIVKFYSRRSSIEIFQNLVGCIEEDHQFFSRFFTPIDPLSLPGLH